MSTEKEQRERVMTERGLLYQLEQKLKIRQNSDRKLARLSTNLEHLLTQNPSKEVLQIEHSVWLGVYEELIVAHDQYQRLIQSPSEKLDDNEEFKHQSKRYQALKESVEQYILKTTVNLETKSVYSKSSSRASSHVLIEKLKEQQRKAELMARAAALKQKKELEEEKLQLKLKEEELEIKTEMEISDAKARILEDLEQSELRDQELEESLQHKDEHNYVKIPENKSVPLNPCAPPWEDHKYKYDLHAPVNDNNNQIPQSASLYQNPNLGNPVPPAQSSSNEMLTVVRELNKPKADLQKFEGNPMDYHRFIRQFNTKICANTDSYEERLNFLLQYTVGEAHKIATGYSHMNAEFGYRAAMNEFKDRYGDPDMIAQAYVKKAINWPVVKTDNAKALDAYGIFLRECLFAIENVEAARILEYSENLKLLVKKLPYYLHEKWRNIVYDLKEKSQVVKFHHLVNFVHKEAKKATDPVYGREVMSVSKSTVIAKQDGTQVKARLPGVHKNFAVTTTEPSRNVNENDKSAPQTNFKIELAFSKPCAFCQGGHSLDACKKFANILLKERYSFLKSKGLCFGCLKSGHLKGSCLRKLSCEHCKKLHPTILHVDSQKKKEDHVTAANSQDNKEAAAVTSAAHMGAGDVMKQALPIVPVRLKSKNSDKYVITYAFLDSGSNATFCLESLARTLNIEGRRTKLNLVTMGQESVKDCCVISGLEVSDLNGDNTLELPPVFTQSSLPVSKSDVVSKEDVKQWSYLRDIDLNMIECDVGLLIGVNVPKAMEPWDVIPSVNNGPFAVKTLLGWVINGPIESTPDFEQQTSVSVSRIDVRRLEEQIRNQFNYDFSERTIDDVHEPSKEDKQFLDQVSNSIHHENGHFVIGLPFRSKTVSVPNNRKQAEQRLMTLVKRFNHNTDFHREYCDFMNKIMAKGYAVKIPTEELRRDDGKVWYLPHHGVYHPKKKKLRVVFDCAARFKGTSLNDKLLSGPNLTNNLVGTLLRFRQEEVAIMGDIESMFYQVHVPKQDSSFLRFLWWENGDTSKPITEYHMTVHLFGASSSPSCANYALRKTATDCESTFDAEVVNTVLRNFYVDDCLKSVKCASDAISLVKDLQRILAMGGFRITKWISNDRDVMVSIPVSERATEVKGLDLDTDNLPTERALGVQWCVESDVFSFKIEVKEKPVTRRGILSMVSTVFDPLGLLAPFVLKAKMILQQLCKLQLAWDDKIPDNLASEWDTWYSDLRKLSNFTVERCLKPPGFGTLQSIQLHHFADASEYGYGTVSYLRLVNTDGKIHCSFLLGKSRVAPLKQTTIPRLELTAATVAVRTDKMLKAELDVHINETVFWTDSMAVLRYIANETSRFYTFVANRLAVIHEGSLPHQWHYINTKLNPADNASRGLSAEKMVKHERWIKAPEFMWEPVDQWPTMPSESLINMTDDDPEVKTLSAKAEECATNKCVDKLINYYSSWHALKKAVAWILKIRKELLRRAKEAKLHGSEQDTSDARASSSKHTGYILYHDLVEAETAVLSYVQQQAFADELITLQEKRPHVRRNSYIRKLDPVLDTDGLLHVGGRLQRADVPEGVKHPIILPRNHHVSLLILRQIHHDLKHSGRNHMLTVLRQKYWLIHASSAIRKLVSKCTICRKQRLNVGEQKMASLPEDRLIPDEPPFTRVGVDYFGPFEVKLKRSRVKRYGVIFTCLASRAVHLDVAASLDTDSYINALRRFIARRGQVMKMRSDNGTNFVGAERELKKAITDWNLSQIQDSMLQKHIDWQFNPPAGSHHGGVWERLIRSIRRVMNSVLKEQLLDDEGLHTLMCEIESILNGRPITNGSDQYGDLQALTPNHLLLMKTKPSLPPGIFVKSDNYCKRRWRQVQYLANLFWNRWVKEYLPLLQERQKWRDVKRNMKVGDVVLIVDPTAPRNSWPMGVVLETIPDNLGFVRQVKVKTATNTLIRPIDKLCLILELD